MARFRLLARFQPFDPSAPEGRSLERHRKILLNTASSFLARIGSLAVNLLVIRLVLARLGREEYGLWIAITAFVAWTTLLDFGVLNGLVNSVSEAFGNQDRRAAAALFSSAFFFLVGVSLFLGLLIVLFIGKAPLAAVFASGGVVAEGRLRWGVIAALAPFIAGIPLSAVRQVYAGYQKAYVSNLFIALSALMTLAAVQIALACGASLPWLVLATGIGTPVAALFNLVYLLRCDMPWLRPRLSGVSVPGLRRLFRSSIPLFLFQVGALLINYSQPILLAHVTSYSVVADYSLLIRLYGLVSTVIVLATASFFPAFREAFERGDHGWLQKNFTRMLALRQALACVLGVALAAGGNAALTLWLGKGAASFPPPVWYTLALVLVVSSWGTAFSDLLTIMDRIWVQLGFVLLNGAATVTLTLWLAPALGVHGALLAFGCVSVLVWSWAGPLLSRPILRFGGRPLPRA